MTENFESGLDQVQACVDEFAGLLAQAAQTGALETAGAALNSQAIKLLAVMGQAPKVVKKDVMLVQRLRCMAATLASCQAQLARQAALSGRALQTLLPTVCADTYANSYAAAMVGRPGQPYGSVGRQSGELRVASA